MIARVNKFNPTERGPSDLIWGQFPTANILMGGYPAEGTIIHEDFELWPAHSSTGSGSVTEKIKGWSAYLDQGGAIADGNVANVDSINLSSDGDNEGAVLCSLTTAVRLLSNSGRKVAFECRLKTSTIADTKHGFFVGLMESVTPTATVPIQASGVMADKNFIGFHRLEGTGNEIDATYKVTGQAETAALASVFTPVADTFMKLGFLFDGVTTIKWFANGAEVLAARITGTTMAAATFPSAKNMGPIIAILNATGTTPGSITVDWIRLGRTFTPGE